MKIPKYFKRGTKFITLGKGGEGKGHYFLILESKTDYLGKLYTISSSDVSYAKFRAREIDHYELVDLIKKGFIKQV